MRKLNIFFVLFALTMLAACTLYMDDNTEEARVLRTGTGYLDEETVEMEGGKGSVTYKLNQNTIPIDDVVEQYIEKVENDTILYFKSSTPDELLPVVGEMMTCGFNERFPNAFCHKCIERTEQKGLYRCVFTKCSYDEAFKVLNVHFEEQPLTAPDQEVILLPEAETEEFFSRLETGENEAASRSAGPRKVYIEDHVDDNIFELPISATMSGVVGPGIAQAQASASVGGKLFIGGHIKGDISFTDQSADIDVLYLGGLELLLGLEASVGSTFTLPISGGLGFRFDCKILGGNIGLVAIPFITINQRLYANAELGMGMSYGFKYKRDPNDKEHEYGELDIIKSHSQAFNYVGTYSPLFFTAFTEHDTEVQLTLGIDYNLGIGFNIGSGLAKAGIGVGLRYYGTFSAPIDKNEYMNAAAFRQKYLEFPGYGDAYISAEAGMAFVAFNPKLTFGPWHITDKQIPYFPVSNEDGYIACKSAKEKSFKASVNLLDGGYLTNYWISKPELRIYDGETKEYITTKELKWKTRDKTHKAIEGKNYLSVLDRYQLSGSFTFPELQYNHEYEGVFSLYFPAIFTGAVFPIDNVPFHVAIPEMKIKKATLARVQSASHGATDEEKANTRIVARRYDPETNMYQWGWVWNGGVYNYRYVVDVDIEVKGHPKFWGFSIFDRSGFERRKFQVNQITELNTLVKEYKVRLYLYSSNPQEKFRFSPFASVDNVDTADTSLGFTEYSTGTFEYVEGGDFPFSVTDGVAYDFLFDHTGNTIQSRVSE